MGYVVDISDFHSVLQNLLLLISVGRYEFMDNSEW